MMPAPRHVIFLRYVGEDGARDEGDGAIVRLAGEITAPGVLCDIVALVAQAGWKGELVVVNGDASRSLFFDAGNILGAQTNLVAERLGALLYRLGVLNSAQLETVGAALGEGRKFGEVAVERGFITPERLFEVIVKQTKEIAFATLLVDDGMFYFLDRYDPARIPIQHHVSANNVLMEGVQRMDESKYFRDRIPSDHHIPVPIAGRSDPEDEFKKVWNACDGRRSILQVGRVCGLGEFEVMRDLFQLVRAGFVHISPPTPEGPEALVGVFNDVMSAIYEAVGRVGKTDPLRQHLSAFATSIGIYDTLFAGAGPSEAGRLDASRIAHNIKSLAGEDPDAVLAQWLYEYASFALFDGGSQLSKDEEQLLSKYVAERIQILAPKA